MKTVGVLAAQCATLRAWGGPVVRVAWRNAYSRLRLQSRTFTDLGVTAYSVFTYVSILLYVIYDVHIFICTYVFTLLYWGYFGSRPCALASPSFI